MSIRDLYKVIYHSIVENDELMFPRNTMSYDDKIKRDEFISRKAHVFAIKNVWKFRHKNFNKKQMWSDK